LVENHGKSDWTAPNTPHAPGQAGFDLGKNASDDFYPLWQHNKTETKIKGKI